MNLLLIYLELVNQKLINEHIKGEQNVCNTHFEVGKKVRKVIADIGGKMPEELPAPKRA